MAPWYMKKKVWVAVVTALAAGAAKYTDNPEIGSSVLYLGLALLAALGLEDFGKAGDARRAEAIQYGDQARVAMTQSLVTVVSDLVARHAPRAAEPPDESPKYRA